MPKYGNLPHSSLVPAPHAKTPTRERERGGGKRARGEARKPNRGFRDPFLNGKYGTRDVSRPSHDAVIINAVKKMK